MSKLNGTILVAASVSSLVSLPWANLSPGFRPTALNYKEYKGE